MLPLKNVSFCKKKNVYVFLCTPGVPHHPLFQLWGIAEILFTGLKCKHITIVIHAQVQNKGKLGL